MLRKLVETSKYVGLVRSSMFCWDLRSKRRNLNGVRRSVRSDEGEIHDNYRVMCWNCRTANVKKRKSVMVSRRREHVAGGGLRVSRCGERTVGLEAIERGAAREVPDGGGLTDHRGTKTQSRLHLEHT